MVLPGNVQQFLRIPARPLALRGRDRHPCWPETPVLRAVRAPGRWLSVAHKENADTRPIHPQVLEPCFCPPD